MRNRRVNQKGVTLVEVMISLVILLIVFMGLIQASILSINNNLRNEMRDEATRIASQYIAVARSTQINNIAGVPPPSTTPSSVLCCAPPTWCGFNIVSLPTSVDRSFRNNSQTFTVSSSGCFTDTTYNEAQFQITVSYTVPGDVAPPSSTTVNSVMRRF